MKLRNQLLALFCILIFAVLGVLYFQAWVVQRPFGIIIFLCDGLTPHTMTATRLYKGGATDRLMLEQFDRFAMVSNASSDYAVPDSAAAATAIATGEKVNNRSVAIDPRGRELTSILKLAKDAGRSVGIVTNGMLTAPGIAPFYAHGANPAEADRFALQLVDGYIDVVLGSGSGPFTPESKGGLRKDGRDLLLEIRDRGEEVIRTKAELEGASAMRSRKLFGFFGGGNVLFSDDAQAAGQPSLADMTRRAIEILQFNQRGYVLVIDAALVTQAAEQNHGEQVLSEMIEVDAAVAAVRQYAGEKSRVIVTGRHAVGGLTLNGYPLRQDHGVALTGKNAFGYPSITWASGPSARADEPAAFRTETALNIACDLLALGVGPGTENLSGFIANTRLFELIKEGL